MTARTCVSFLDCLLLLLHKWNVVNAAIILEETPCAARSPEVNSSIESIGDGPWLLRRLDGTNWCPSRRSFSISSQMIQMQWRPMHSVSPDVASLGTRSMVCFIRQGKSAFAVSHPSRQQSSEDLEMVSRIAFGAQSRAEHTKETSLYISVERLCWHLVTTLGDKELNEIIPRFSPVSEGRFGGIMESVELIELEVDCLSKRYLLKYAQSWIGFCFDSGSVISWMIAMPCVVFLLQDWWDHPRR